MPIFKCGFLCKTKFWNLEFVNRIELVFSLVGVLTTLIDVLCDNIENLVGGKHGLDYYCDENLVG
jgi:hypothetical protein